MEAKELRVGNLIKDRGDKILRIDWFECNKVCQKITIENIEVHPLTESFEFIQPIPLTEEWLLKFGFEVLREYSVGNIYAMVKNGLFFDDLKITHWPNKKEKFVRKNLCIQSVHQLQNLYYALTGEELKPS